MPRKSNHSDSTAFDQLIEAAGADVLRSLVRKLAAAGPEVKRACLEYLSEHVPVPPSAVAQVETEALFTLWDELQPDLADLDEYGRGDYDTQNTVGELLYDLAQKLKVTETPRDDRRALLDEVLSYIRSGNAGMDDALYDVAYAACHDEQDLRDLAERFESLGRDWPLDHARRIYRRVGDREKYLSMRLADLKYGGDYHDLATFYWEEGERDKAVGIAQKGLREGQGRMDDLRTFLSERAVESGDRNGYLEMQFAQATDRVTLKSYQVFKQLCSEGEWKAFEPRMLTAVEKAWEDERLQIYFERGEHDRAVGLFANMRYPDERYDDSKVLEIAAELESDYPEEILAFYTSGLGRLDCNDKREAYARKAAVAAKVRRVMVEGLNSPEKWREFARVLPDWKSL